MLPTLLTLILLLKHSFLLTFLLCCTDNLYPLIFNLLLLLLKLSMVFSLSLLIGFQRFLFCLISPLKISINSTFYCKIFLLTLNLPPVPKFISLNILLIKFLLTLLTIILPLHKPSLYYLPLNSLIVNFITVILSLISAFLFPLLLLLILLYMFLMPIFIFLNYNLSMILLISNPFSLMILLNVNFLKLLFY